MATCVLNGVTAGQNARLQAVDFSFTHPTEDSLAVSWSPLPQNYAIQCYFIILLNFCYTKTADSTRTSKGEHEIELILAYIQSINSKNNLSKTEFYNKPV